MSTKIICVVNDIAIENAGLKSEHGLSFWIETENGVVLLDSGQSSEVFSHNLSVLDLDAAKVKAVALSHGHNDHTGGLAAILDHNPEVDIYANPGIMTPRYSLKKGEYIYIGMPENVRERLAEAHLHISAEPQEIVPGLWTSGKIEDRQEREGGSANHFIRSDDSWQADHYRDDLSLVLEMDDSIALICGCCHAGLLNTLFQVQSSFSKPVAYIFGGTHLVTSEKPYLSYLKDKLNEHFPKADYYLNHCTGSTAIQYLSKKLDSRVMEFPAGRTVEIG